MRRDSIRRRVPHPSLSGAEGLAFFARSGDLRSPWLRLIRPYELNGVNLIPPGNDVGRERNLDAIRFECSLGKFHDEIVQVFRRIIALPHGVSPALLIKYLNFNYGSRATGFAHPHLARVHRFGIFQVQPFDAAIGSFRCPRVSVVRVSINIGRSGRLIGRDSDAVPWASP